MVRRGIAYVANDFQHIEPSWLSVTYCGEYEGSKKTPETDVIFDNVWEMNALADADMETLRISIDTKATVNIGEYSRHGRSRGLEPVKALDHDMRMKEKLIPGGILEPVSGRAFLFFTGSYKTSCECVIAYELLIPNIQRLSMRLLQQTEKMPQTFSESISLFRESVLLI